MIHRIVIFYDEDKQCFDWLEWSDSTAKWAYNDDVLLTDEEYAILKAEDPKQKLMQEIGKG